jgi:hypothetical protein
MKATIDFPTFHNIFFSFKMIKTRSFPYISFPEPFYKNIKQNLKQYLYYTTGVNKLPM